MPVGRLVHPQHPERRSIFQVGLLVARRGGAPVEDRHRADLELARGRFDLAMRMRDQPIEDRHQQIGIVLLRGHRGYSVH